jgi:tetratricopeptide (TPR) repeat protein
LEIYRQLGDRRGEAQMINDMGLVHGTARRPDKAAECFRLALAIRRDIGDRHGEATALCNLGSAYTRMGRLNEAGPPESDMDGGVTAGAAPDLVKAIECYERSLAIRREIGDRAGEGESCNGLGNACRRLCRFDEAIAYYEGALSRYREMGDLHGEGVVLSNIGVTFADRRQFTTATEYYRRALAIYESIGHRSSQAVILSNLGKVHLDRREVAVALECYQRALALFRAVKDRYGEALTVERIENLRSGATSLVDVADDEEHRAEDGDHVGDQGAAHELGEDLDVVEAGGAELHAPWGLVAAGDEVVAVDAEGVLGPGVGVAGGGLEDLRGADADRARGKCG